MVSALADVAAWNGKDLLVFTGLVFHDEDADRATVDHRSRHDHPGVAYKDVDRVPVLG